MLVVTKILRRANDLQVGVGLNLRAQILTEH
jgi:hypothetical protein